MAQNAKNLVTLDRVRMIVIDLSYSGLPTIAEVAPGAFSRAFAKRAKQSPRAWRLAAWKGRTGDETGVKW